MRTKQKNRIRKSTKYVYIAISIILIIVSLLHLFTASSRDGTIESRTEQIYSYKNKFNYEYNVNLIANDYTEGMDLSDKSLVYITSLIDNIDLDLNYEYSGDKDLFKITFGTGTDTIIIKSQTRYENFCSDFVSSCGIHAIFSSTFE